MEETKEKKFLHRLNNLIDELDCVWFKIVRVLNKFCKIIGTGVRVIIVYLSPIVLGVFLEPIVSAIRDKSFIWEWNLLFNNYPSIIIAIIYVFAALRRLRANYRRCHIDRIEDCIKSIFDDLEIIHIDGISDIRCTVWTPINSKRPPEKMRIKQIIDYHPKHSGSKTILPFGTSGRIMKVTRKVKSDGKINIMPLGIVGLCIHDATRNTTTTRSIEPILRNYSPDELPEKLRNELNFTKAQIKRLAPNRLSYLCYPILNYYKDDVLALLYFDSSIQNEINRSFANEIQ